MKVVYSTEPPRPLFPVRQFGEDAPPQEDPPRPGKPKTNVPGSVSFVPGAAGLILAGVFTAVYFFKVNVFWVIMICGCIGFFGVLDRCRKAGKGKEKDA